MGGVSHTLLTSSDVINNTTSTSTTQALSANQGKLLNDRVAKLESTKVLGGGKVSLYYENGTTMTANVTLPENYVSGETSVVITVIGRSQTPYTQLRQDSVFIPTNGSRTGTIKAYGSFVSGHVLEVSWLMFKYSN